jgi:ubiquinone/menaquinone biosynthesis C-methylase UbiE
MNVGSSGKPAGTGESPFDLLHSAMAGSASYRAVIRSCSPDLPEWLVPTSVIDMLDLQTIERALDVGEGELVVDLGCGGGGVAVWVAEMTGASIIGIDRSAVAVRAATALARARGLSSRARFEHADLTATNLPDERADGVMSVDALMFADPLTGVAEIARLLKPGGKAAIRTVESLVEPFTSTLVRDYRPIFERSGLIVLRHEAVANYGPRSLAFFQGLADRAEAMRAEIGSAAEILIAEALDSIEKATRPARVQTVYVEARRVALP